MGFSYETSKQFFDCFLRHYLNTDDEDRIREVSEKASLIGYSRMIKKIRKRGELSDADNERIQSYADRISDLVSRLDTLTY